MTERVWSLTARLSRRVLGAMTLGWLVALVVGLLVLWEEVGELMNDALDADARMLLAVISSAPETARATLGLRQPGSDQELRVLGVPGTSLPVPWPSLTGDGHHIVDGWHVARLSDPASGVTIELGHSTAWRMSEFREAAGTFLGMMVPVLGLVLWAMRATMRDGLAPARDLARRMEQRSAGDLSPIAEAGLPQELRPIPQALNGYLARIRDLVQAERQFASNAAHELRTPLAVAASQAQLMRRGEAGPEAAAAIGTAVDRLSATVERLLQLSRAESGLARAEGRADLIRVCRLVIDEMTPLPGGRRILFDDGDAESCAIATDPDALAILLRNLVGNAVAHGLGEVRVRLGEGPTLEIRNPVPPDAAFRTDRFDKGPNSGGSGLGLPIALAIADQIGARIGFGMEQGQATVTLRFDPGPSQGA